jgi:hypothetical protein
MGIALKIEGHKGNCGGKVATIGVINKGSYLKILHTFIHYIPFLLMAFFKKIATSFKKLSNRRQIINTSETTSDIQSNTPITRSLYCGECHAKLYKHGWCFKCGKNRLFEQNFDKWTSGNKDIDNFIQNIQISTIGSNQAVEWIPFSEFTDIKKIGEGGFGQVYKANWKEGQILSWNTYIKDWNRYKHNRIVALKTVSTIEKLINEVIDY